MNLIRATKHFFQDPAYKIVKFALHFVPAAAIPDKLFLKYQFHYVFGYRLDLKHPKTFNEKLQWLKLYDRNPLYTTLVDKYAVKQWVADKIGEQYVIPTLAVYDSVDEICWDDLPEQFVMKCTHDSGSTCICKDKASFDIETAKKTLKTSLATDFYIKNREWPYKKVPHRIIAEKYTLDRETGSLPDYKFFCFDGEVKMMFVATERQNMNSETRFDFYDKDFNHIHLTNGHPMADKMPRKPDSFDEMIKVATQLSKGIKHVRVDLFEANGKIFFGEMTFYHWGGFTLLEPSSWDKQMGDWIKIP